MLSLPLCMETATEQTSYMYKDFQPLNQSCFTQKLIYQKSDAAIYTEFYVLIH